MSRNITNIIFLLIFSIQILPIMEVGRVLFQASMIEELTETDSGKSTAGLEDSNKYFLSSANYSNLQFSSFDNDLYIHLSEILPLLRASDVHTPPPDLS